LESQPLVSIVTPSLNLARDVEQTVRSVLEQDYPRIEYVLMDGGSTDGTLDVLRRFEDRLELVSEADEGPADAVNKGMRRTNGSVIAFLNADDYYLPGAVTAAVAALEQKPGVAAVYGDGVWVDEGGAEIRPYPVAEFDGERLREQCFICQPAAFLRREAWEAIGGLDASLQYTFDYDLWIRLARRHSMVRIPGRLAASRMHAENISIGSRAKVFEETIGLLKRHYGYVPFDWIHSYVSFLEDGRDLFSEPLRPGFKKYLRSLPVGLRHNSEHPLRYLNEWRKVMSLGGLRRRVAGMFGGR
jgi:glycosyltransferase involved in cell wall biosynthesis